jgi:thioredoxin-related protein
LPLLENNLDTLSDEYNVIALAHSDVEPTMEWVRNNLNGELTIGFSTKDLRDNLQVVGQPITIIFDTNGNIESREFGYIP